MEINILEEAGIRKALVGMKFSHEVECPLEEVYCNNDTWHDGSAIKTAEVLASKDGGHNKFLESIIVWFDMRAKLKFWKQFDTYRVGITKQSKSTMHSILKRPLTQEDFGHKVSERRLHYWNNLVGEGRFEELTDDLSEGYLQTRRVCCSYKSIRTIIKQRHLHKLPEWGQFCLYMKENLEYPELLGGDL